MASGREPAPNRSPVARLIELLNPGRPVSTSTQRSAVPIAYRFANKVGRRRMSSASRSRTRVARSRSDKGINVGYGADPGKSQDGMLAALRRVIARIPKGKVATYGAVAEAAGFPGGARQVAWAL